MVATRRNVATITEWHVKSEVSFFRNQNNGEKGLLFEKSGQGHGELLLVDVLYSNRRHPGGTDKG